MHMEFVTVGKASSDKIHVKYNDKIATFHGEIGIDYFLVLSLIHISEPTRRS